MGGGVGEGGRRREWRGGVGGGRESGRRGWEEGWEEG